MLRDDVLKLVEAFPGSAVWRIGRFFDGARPYVEALHKEGLVRIERRGAGGRPADFVWPATPLAEALAIRADLVEEHKAAVSAVALGLRRIAVEGEAKGASAAKARHVECALAMAQVMFRAPHRYSREAALADLVQVAGGDPMERSWMRGARLLEREGLLNLFERKGAGRTTTVQIRNPPPYPIE